MSRTKRTPAVGTKIKHIMRHPKTQQERRESCAAKEDGVPWRARRNAKNVPSAWDDRLIASLSERPKRVS